MTYGWAILIVVIVVAALYAMGVFTASPSVACSPCFSNFAYVDYSNTNGTLVIRNGPQTIRGLLVTGGNTTNTTEITSGELISITGINTDGDQDITLTYTVTASGLQHTDTATIHN